MAVAAPARRSTAAPAPAPSRTTPPKRKAPARKPKRARAMPAPAKAPARRAPARKPATKRRPAATQPKLVVAAGRTAVAVRQLPDSGLIVRMTRGRAWIAVLGILLVGIVALNVATLSFAASAGKIDEQITALEKENSMLESREAQKLQHRPGPQQRRRAGPGDADHRRAGPDRVPSPPTSPPRPAASRLPGAR